jgi:hypothetical protein
VIRDERAPVGGEKSEQAAALDRARKPQLPGPRRRHSDREPVLSAEVTVGRGRKREVRHLEAMNAGLAWGTQAHPLLIPWAAIRGFEVDGNDIVIRYDWPYVMDGEKVIRAAVGSLSAYLFAEEIERRRREERFAGGEGAGAGSAEGADTAS